MKKFCNTTLYTLLSFLLSFNLYGQILEEALTSEVTDVSSDANPDLIIEDVVWDAALSDLISFYADNNAPLPFSLDVPTLNGISIPESFHMVILTSDIASIADLPSSIYTSDMLVAPTSKPVIFVYRTSSTYGLSLILDENGFLDEEDTYGDILRTGVASTASVMGRQSDDNSDTALCIVDTASPIEDSGLDIIYTL